MVGEWLITMCEHRSQRQGYDTGALVGVRCENPSWHAKTDSVLYADLEPLEIIGWGMAWWYLWCWTHL